MEVENTYPRRTRGLTLIELITTVAVAGISLAVLIPSWSGLTNRSHITTAANQLLTQLRFARNEAVTRNRAVSLCPSIDSVNCSGDPGGWDKGYMVFVDIDNSRDRSPGESILQLVGAQPAALRLHSTTGRPSVRFRPDGAAWSTNTTFSICLGDDTASNRAVVLYGTGRARVDRHIPGRLPVTCT